MGRTGLQIQKAGEGERECKWICIILFTTLEQLFEHTHIIHFPRAGPFQKMLNVPATFQNDIKIWHVQMLYSQTILSVLLVLLHDLVRVVGPATGKFKLTFTAHQQGHSAHMICTVWHLQKGAQLLTTLYTQHCFCSYWNWISPVKKCRWFSMPSMTVTLPSQAMWITQSCNNLAIILI